jgi:hypothetical protein
MKGKQMEFNQYYVLTKDVCIHLGEHQNKNDAELRGIDRHNIHQVASYFILTEKELLSLSMDIAEAINETEVF